MDTLKFLDFALLVALVSVAVALLTRALVNYPALHRAIIRISLTRYSWLTGLLLIGLVPAACLGAPALLWNLFVIAGPDFFWVTLMTVLAATSVILTGRVTLHNAAERFDDLRHQIAGLAFVPRRAGWSRRTWLMFLALAIPVTAFAAFASWADREKLTAAVVCRDALWMLAGLAAAMVWLLAHAWLHWVFLSGATIAEGLLPFEGWFANYRDRSYDRVNRLTGMLAMALRKLGPGYEHDGQPRPGHVQSIVFGAFGLLGYAAVYTICILAGPRGGVWVPFPALSLLLLVIVLVGYALTAVAFALDYYRVPPLLAVALLSAALYWINDTDHYFQLHPDRHAAASSTQFAVTALTVATVLLIFFGLRRHWRLGMVPLVVLLLALGGIYLTWFSSSRYLATADRRTDSPTRADVPRFQDLAKAWTIPPGRDHKRTLVVVSASGGGIQASAWTAKVLTALDDRYGSNFRGSVKMISSVSGGSLGTAAYLRGIKSDVQEMPAERLDEINRLARASSLEAGVWGIAFPDLLRLAFPPLAPRMKDRGWALEGAWREGFRGLNAHAWNDDDGDWRLSHLMKATSAGAMPVVAFNAVHAETGRRLVISPVVNQTDPNRAAVALAGPPHALEYWHLFDPEHADSRIATAVRLSATFPYVSPMSRADLRLDVDQEQSDPTHDPREKERRLLQQGHFVDGGYVDNEGLLTIVEWLRPLMPLLDDKDKRPFDRVLILRIIPFAPEKKVQAQLAAESQWPEGAAAPKGADAAADDADIRHLARTGWLNEFIGPVNALIALRGTSQNERNSLVLDLFSRQYLPKGEEHAPGANVYFVQFVFNPKDSSVAPPLSWKLNRRQDQQLNTAWTDLERLEVDNNSPLKVLDDYFLPRDGAVRLGPLGSR